MLGTLVFSPYGHPAHAPNKNLAEAGSVRYLTGHFSESGYKENRIRGGLLLLDNGKYCAWFHDPRGSFALFDRRYR